jgi:hypothetical protein
MILALSDMAVMRRTSMEEGGGKDLTTVQKPRLQVP